MAVPSGDNPIEDYPEPNKPVDDHAAEDRPGDNFQMRLETIHRIPIEAYPVTIG